MNKFYETEFEVIELILSNNFKTSCVDSLCLSLIKMERQIRKIISHILFQYEFFNDKNKNLIITSIAKNRNLYFNNFIEIFDKLYSKNLEDIYGLNYAEDFKNILNLKPIRNKIFHGQLTGTNLKEEALKIKIQNIQSWCSTLAISMKAEIGYCGFERPSFRKSTMLKPENLKIEIQSIKDLKLFLNII